MPMRKQIFPFVHVTILVPFRGFHGGSLVVLWHHDVNNAPLQCTQHVTLRENYEAASSYLQELDLYMGGGSLRERHYTAWKVSMAHI